MPDNQWAAGNSAEPRAVLLVIDKYATSINREVAQVLTGAGRKVYCTVLQATEEDRKAAKADGVELILPTCSKEDEREPNLKWLTFDHPSRYPRLPEDVGYIVGHAEVTSRAAAAIQELRFPQASLGLVIGTIPEDTEKYKDDEEAMGIGRKEDSIRQDAEKADVVFSLGHNIHDHFTISFCAILENKKPTHHLFLPKPSDLFQKTTVEYTESKQKVVLSIGGVNKVERVKGYDFVAKSLAKVAETSQERIIWRIYGVSREEFRTSMAILKASIDSGKLTLTLLPEGTQEDISRHMQQAHLVLMPSRAEPFGLVGLEAMAAGVPVLISNQSGLATLVEKVIPEFHHSILEIEGDDSVDVGRWASQIKKVLRMSEAEFKRAAELKAKLLESRYWEESHQLLLQACGGAVVKTTMKQSSADVAHARLAVGVQQPPVGVQQPPTGGLQPPTGVQQPPTGVQQPPTGVQQPPTGVQQPPAGMQQPPARMQQPPAGVQQPPTRVQQPPLGVQKPPTLVQKLTAWMQKRTGRVQQPPAGVQQPPAGVQQPPVGVQQPPAEVQQPPTWVQQPTTGVQQPPAGVKQPPTGVQQPPAGVQQPPAGVQQPPAGVQQPPAEVQQPPTWVQQPTTGVQQPPTGVQQSPTGVQQPPTGVQQPPAGMQQPPTGVQQPPTGVQQPPTGVQQPPTGVQQPPAGVQQPPTGVQQPPTGVQQQTPITDMHSPLFYPPPELQCSGPVLPVRLHLGLGQGEDIIKEEIMQQIEELERTLFTAEVKRDPKVYLKMLRVFLPHAGILVNLLSGSVLLLLTFLRQTDVDRFYHNHYRVGEGTLSQQLSHILISDDLQDKVKGAQLIVRLQVKHEDYVRVRSRLGQGLDRTTSMDNLPVMPPPSRHVDHSSLLSVLDLAVIGRKDQSCTDRTDDIPTLNLTARQVQAAMQTAKEKSQQQVRRLEGGHREQMHTVRVQMRTAKEQTDAMVRSLTKEISRLREKEEKAHKILLEQKGKSRS
ncbi:hypothetical protein Bbelb_231000 [Branchiostoma belcheri]|nr:hypothetical protein Bbelb_231000 [Branchiostoma belcheri]